MQNNNSKINYKVYARKSSESEDKQALSIESQIEEIKKFILTHKVDVNDGMVLQESKSAKKPYGRAQFEILIRMIEKGEAQGIIAWHCNRLSRNAIDAARLIDLFDKGLLIEIITQQQVFRNTPQDKFMLMLFCSQAKMENDNKGIDVKRGLRKKYQMGQFPGVAKLGYVNDYGDKGNRKVLVDAERFDRVKQLWDLFLTGKYSVRKLLAYANDVLGLRNIKRKKEGGKPIKLSSLYCMLKDPFYAGFFYANNEDGVKVRYEVSETIPRMITEEQFWQVQNRLGLKGRPRPVSKKDIFPYSGWGTCECGCVMTAEEKFQLICPKCRFKFAYKNRTDCPKCNTPIEKMDNPTYLHYKYYHCTKKKGTNCKGNISEKDIDNYVAGYFQENLKISPELSKWCIDNLEHLEKYDQKNEFERKEAWINEKEKKEKQLNKLVTMKTMDQLTDEEYNVQRGLIKAEVDRINAVLGDTAEDSQRALEEAKKVFNLAVGVVETFRSGTFEDKQEVLSTLGSNLRLKEKKVSISNKKLVSIIVNGLLQAKKDNPRFEPENSEANKDKTEVFASVCPTLLRG